MIPKIIHYCWFGGAKKPKSVKKCIKSWKRYCPNYKIVEWNESNFDVNQYSYTKGAYQAGKWAFVSDVARLHIVYNNGGIYLDTDVELIQSLDSLLAYSSFWGFEDDRHIATGLGFGAIKGDSYVKAVLDDYLHMTFVSGGVKVFTPCTDINTRVFEKLGVKIENKTQHIGKAAFLSSEYLCPIDYATGRKRITENTISIHHYDSSWHSRRDNIVKFIAQRCTRYFGENISKKTEHFLYLLLHMDFVGIYQKLHMSSDEKKDYGIITFFYNSANYGAVLQAYALAKTVNDMGYSCEQIRYDANALITIKHWVKKILTDFVNYKTVISDIKILNGKKRRKKAIGLFNKKYIPQSVKIYTNRTLKNLNEIYSGFITGSDQVWSGTTPAYFLDFADSEKNKISYAASISRNELTEEQKAKFPKSLKTFSNVSVREKTAVSQLAQIGVPAEWVLDPTMLLSADEWCKIVSARIIHEKYIFCYLLGDNDLQRAQIHEYAKKHDIKIVTLPYMTGHYRKCDKNFGDIRLFDVSPSDFLSLIKFSETVITDSFHATVFSYIFKKEFITYDRKYKGESMSSRIIDLLSLTGLNSNFVTDDSCNIDEALSKCQMSASETVQLGEQKERSRRYLYNSLKGKDI